MGRKFKITYVRIKNKSGKSRQVHLRRAFSRKTNPLRRYTIKNEELIGYGGLVHINWINKSAEISFLMNTKLESKYFSTHWKMFLKLIKEIFN